MFAQRKGFTLIELMIVVAIIAILAAIAIPNFIRFQARSKQSEVQANLKAFFVAEKSYYAANDTYSENMCKTGFAPERGNRYTYWSSGVSGGPNDAYRSTPIDGLTTLCANQADVQGLGADTFQYGTNSGITDFMSYSLSASMILGANGNYVATAFSNIDDDDTLDVWSVSSFTRPDGPGITDNASCAAGNNPAGEPCLDQDDVSE